MTALDVRPSTRIIARQRDPHPDLFAELVVCSGQVCSLARLTSLGPDRFRLDLDDPAVLSGMAHSAEWHRRAEEIAARGHQMEVWAQGERICTLGAVTLPAGDAARHFALLGTTFARVSSGPYAATFLA